MLASTKPLHRRGAEAQRAPAEKRKSFFDFLCVTSASLRLCGKAVAVFLLTTGAALAQNYPTRPIRMVVPQPAGGTMDTVMRALGEQLSRQMGQQFVIDNRGGANGLIAGELVAKAPPDGYTMIYTTNSLATTSW